SLDVPERPDGPDSGTAPGLNHPRRNQSPVKVVRLPRLLPGLVAVLGLFLSQASAQAAFVLRPSGTGGSATVVVLLTVPDDWGRDPDSALASTNAPKPSRNEPDNFLVKPSADPEKSGGVTNAISGSELGSTSAEKRLSLKDALPVRGGTGGDSGD